MNYSQKSKIKMTCPHIGKLNLFVVFALVIAQQPQVFAEESIDTCQVNINQVAKKAIQEIKTSEILANSVEQVDNQQSLLAAKPRLNDLITRPLIWEMRVNKTDLPINASQIRYEVITDNKNGNPFNYAVVKPQNFNDAVRDCDEKTAVIKGEATLEFRDLQQLRPTRTQEQPAPFQATIVVCVSGKTC